MKNIFLILCILFSIFMFPQLKPGTYIIKLDYNQKAIQLDGFELPYLRETCAPNSFCEFQYWEVKSVRGQNDAYIIQSFQIKKCFTFKEFNNGRDIASSVLLDPKKPLATIRNQSFIIKEYTPGKYTIQPFRDKGLEKDNDIYLMINSTDLNKDGSLLKFDKPTANTASNLLFSFYPVEVASTVKITQGLPTISSPSVYVTPKSDNNLDLDFKTGGDNLDPKDFMEGLKITIKIRNKPDIIKENANESKEWPNNSIRRVTINIPADVVCADINEVILSRDTKSRSVNNMTAIVGDNWNLDKVTITSRFKMNGVIKSNSMNYLSPSGSSFPLYRFTYEDRDCDINTGKILTLKVNGICSTQNTTTNSTPSNSNAKLTCIFGTGGDNLEGGNDNNVDIKIKFKSSTKVLTIRNINDTAKWNNFTENTVTKEILNSNDIDINDIKEVEVRHTGGGGMFADNWHVDKIKITINKGEQSKVLVD